jgi:hypothetical protein
MTYVFGIFPDLLLLRKGDSQMSTGDLLTSLAPAVAAGFAVQRLLEIADPLTEMLFKGVRKKVFLGILSLVVGLGLSWELGLHLLEKLGLSDGKGWLDILVTGLFISGGTEGFNSVLKFLEYQKDEQKADAAVSAVSMGVASDGLRAMSASLTLSTVEDVYKQALQDAVRNFKNDPSINIDFKNGKLNQHVATDDQAQGVVLDATATAADEFDRVLNGTGMKLVRGGISRNTSYGTAVGVMQTAVAKGADLKQALV